MVGLRWWSAIKDDGTEEWYFESLGENRQTSKVDKSVFWIANYTVPILWGLFAFTSLLSLNLGQIVLCLIGGTLGGINLLGYIRCEKNHKAHVQGFLIGQAKKNLSTEQMTKLGAMAAKEAMRQ